MEQEAINFEARLCYIEKKNKILDNKVAMIMKHTDADITKILKDLKGGESEK